MAQLAGATELGRSPTFVVDSERQRGTLDVLVRREQHFSEQYSRNKPLCFNAKPFQKTHPKKANIARQLGRKDADATLVSPMLVAIADGVSQIEEFGIDASVLPNELLNAIEERAVSQLLPGQETEEYLGPISMMRDAYEATESLGSTTILTATMDNSTRIHGKLHPMIAICSIGDCEILVLRRTQQGVLAPAFHTEMQRIDGNAQSPLQLARVDETVDPNFDESIMTEVIEKGSAVHCVSAYEGDVVVLGTDGVFDNLYIDEIVAICNEMLFTSGYKDDFQPISRSLLGQVAKRIVMECHQKTQPVGGMYMDAPIGKGGKVDDTSCIVGEVVEWTDEHGEAWSNLRRRKYFRDFFSCGGALPVESEEIVVDEQYDDSTGARVRNYPMRPNASSFSTYWGGSFSEFGGSFASFSSLASGWGRVKEGERSHAVLGPRPDWLDAATRPTPGPAAAPRRKAQRKAADDDESDEEACTIM
jgi:protein phosphatase PTC7